MNLSLAAIVVTAFYLGGAVATFSSAMVVLSSTIRDDFERNLGPRPPMWTIVLSSLVWPFSMAALLAANRREE